MACELDGLVLIAEDVLVRPHVVLAIEEDVSDRAVFLISGGERITSSASFRLVCEAWLQMQADHDEECKDCIPELSNAQTGFTLPDVRMPV